MTGNVRYAMMLRSVKRVCVRFYDTTVTRYCCSASTGSKETNVIWMLSHNIAYCITEASVPAGGSVNVTVSAVITSLLLPVAGRSR